MTQEELLAAAQQYSRTASEWFRNGEAALKEKETEILAQAKLEAPGLKEAVTDLTDVVRALRHNQDQIHENLRHGFQAQQAQSAASALAPSAESAFNAALRAIDESIQSWLRLKEVFPESEDTILDLLVLLERLRRATLSPQRGEGRGEG
ncbi:MAG TPA: hypothetical protein VNU68_27750 [Verrucomicrobiae bacterium]|nr:hypothetical protein [Verrucomicrobiae bacterium]